MNTDWTELIFVVAAEDARRAEALLSSCSETGLYVEDYSDMEAMLPLVGAADYVDEALTAKSRDTAAIHLYISSDESAEDILSTASAALRNAGIAFEQRTAALPETDWENDWKKEHKAHRVGKRLLLCPTWETPEPNAGDVVLRIDPGGAFGSGEDTTTTLCLQVLEKQLRGGERVLDMGCGSGVLAIAALLLGAESALGVDIDPRVLTEAPAFAEQNGVSTKLAVLCGNVLKDDAFSASIGEDYDLICGNMVADVQLLMATVYAEKLRAGGLLVLSGVLSTRARETSAAISAAGLSLIDSVYEGDWTALTFIK